MQTNRASHVIGKVVSSVGTEYSISAYITLTDNVFTVEVQTSNATLSEIYPLSLVSLETSDGVCDNFRYVQQNQ